MARKKVFKAQTHEIHLEVIELTTGVMLFHSSHSLSHLARQVVEHGNTQFVLFWRYESLYEHCGLLVEAQVRSQYRRLEEGNALMVPFGAKAKVSA